MNNIFPPETWFAIFAFAAALGIFLFLKYRSEKNIETGQIFFLVILSLAIVIALPLFFQEGFGVFTHGFGLFVWFVIFLFIVFGIAQLIDVAGKEYDKNKVLLLIGVILFLIAVLIILSFIFPISLVRQAAFPAEEVGKLVTLPFT